MEFFSDSTGYPVAMWTDALRASIHNIDRSLPARISVHREEYLSAGAALLPPCGTRKKKYNERRKCLRFFECRHDLIGDAALR